MHLWYLCWRGWVDYIEKQWWPHSLAECVRGSRPLHSYSTLFICSASHERRRQIRTATELLRCRSFRPTRWVDGYEYVYLMLHVQLGLTWTAQLQSCEVWFSGKIRLQWIMIAALTSLRSYGCSAYICIAHYWSIVTPSSGHWRPLALSNLLSICFCCWQRSIFIVRTNELHETIIIRWQLLKYGLIHSVLYFPADNVAPNSPCYVAVHQLLHLM